MKKKRNNFKFARTQDGAAVPEATHAPKFIEPKDIDLTVSIDPEKKPDAPLFKEGGTSLLHRATYPGARIEEKNLPAEEVKRVLLLHCVEHFIANRARSDDFAVSYFIDEKTGDVTVTATSELLPDSPHLQNGGIIGPKDINPLLKRAAEDAAAEDIQVRKTGEA